MDARFERLLRSALPTARRMLAEHGEFYPFASVLRPEGEVEHLGPGLDEERPPSDKVVEALLAILREERSEGRIGALAISSDVRVEDEAGRAIDAVRVSLEHGQGASIEVFAPYGKDADGELRFGELSSRPSPPRVFGDPRG